MLIPVMGHFDIGRVEAREVAVDSSGDAMLLAAAAGGDSVALSRLYDEHSARVFGMAFRILGDHSRAEEVTQDVFLAVWLTGADAVR